MKTTMVRRYNCDFCNKRGFSVGHMRKHEAHCTLNPDRVCRVCKMVEGTQRPIEELKAFLPQRTKSAYDLVPDEDGAHSITNGDSIKAEINLALKSLREVCSNCPACIMAALRQSNIPMWIASDFDFSEEMKSIWSDIRDAEVERCSY